MTSMRFIGFTGIRTEDDPLSREGREQYGSFWGHRCCDESTARRLGEDVTSSVVRGHGSNHVYRMDL